MPSSLHRRALPLLGVVALTFSLLAGSGIASAAPSLSARDQAFITTAAQSGLYEIEGGKAGLAKADAYWIKVFGFSVWYANKNFGKELKAIADAGGVALPTAPDEDQQLILALLAPQTGTPFQCSYLAIEYVTHTQIIDVFTDEAASGDSAELRAFATKTLPHLKFQQWVAQELLLTTPGC